jgi:hypothetical protein
LQGNDLAHWVNPLWCGQPPRLASSSRLIEIPIERHAATQAWGACNPYS